MPCTLKANNTAVQQQTDELIYIFVGYTVSSES